MKALSSLLTSLPSIAGLIPASLQQLTITGISMDSRLVNEGDLYLAIQPDPQNPAAHGGLYLEAAFAAGAKLALLDATLVDSLKCLSELFTQRLIIVPDLAELAGDICAAWFDYPAEASQIVGITGTNGKSSCAWFLAQAANQRNRQAKGAFIGTLGSGFVSASVTENWQETTHTTPDALQLQADLKRLKHAEIIALEVSSHALVQRRVNATQFKVGAFTNLSQDHLDYHGDMNSYLDAKAGLFEHCEVAAAVINIDDEYGQKLADRVQILVDKGVISKRLTVSKKVAADIVVVQLPQSSEHGLHLQINTPKGVITAQTRLLGDFNAANLGLVSAVLLMLDWSLQDVQRLLTVLQPVPGRMQSVNVCEDQPLVIVDYAHTPAALETLLLSSRKHTSDNLWCIVGCGGDRDRGKRPQMAAIASRLADRVIFTSDNPRNESIESIIEDMLAGVPADEVNKITCETKRHTAIETRNFLASW